MKNSIVDGLKPYPKYKDSGQEWLGAIPDHWSILPNRAIFAEVKDRNHSDEEMLSVTITRGVIRQRSLLADSSKKDSSNQDKAAYKLVCPNDIAYNKMRAWQGAIGASELRGIISPAYVVMRLREANNARYFHHLYRTPHFAKEAERWSYGITSDMWSLRPEHFKIIYSPLPPHDEQIAIVRFLNYADRRIESYIRAKKKVIALLNEQKQSIIHQAVTRGLDTTIRLKPSGIDWLDNIPEHWQTTSVKRSARKGNKTFTDGDWIETPFITYRGVRLIQTGNIGIGVYREKGFRYISEETFQTFRCTEVEPNNVLICRLDGPVGRACLAPELGAKMITSVDNTILKVRDDIEPCYIVYLMSTSIWLNSIQSICRAGGGFRFRVSRSMLGAIKLPIPPIEEQRRIVEYLNYETAELDKIIKKIHLQIERLKEYRTQLNTSVVTGKLDVREAATKLREEAKDIGESLLDNSDEEIDEADASPGEDNE